MKYFMYQIAADGRDGYRNASRLTSSDDLRSWCASNRNMTCRTFKNQKAAKLMSERYDHVETFASALKSFEDCNPQIFADGDRF